MPLWEIEAPDGTLFEVEGEQEPTEQDILDFFPQKEEAAPQQPQFPVLKPGATFADALRQPSPIIEPQTGVVRSVLPGVLQPEDLLPAVRKIGGETITGEQGDTHPDIIKREGIPAVDIDQRGFTGPVGEFYDREKAAEATGIPTMREPTRLHSTDLSAFQEPEGYLSQLQQAAKAEEPEPLVKIPDIPDWIKEGYAAPTRAILGDKAADTELAIANSLYQSAKSVPEFLTTEEGMLSLLASMVPIGRLGVTAYFTRDMAKSLLDKAKDIGGKWDSMTVPQKAAAVTDAAAQLGFTALLAKATIGEPGVMSKYRPEPIAEPPVIPAEVPKRAKAVPAEAKPDEALKPTPAAEITAATTDPNAIAQALGVRYDGKGPKDSNHFTMYGPDGKPGTTFTVLAGENLKEAHARYETIRAKWEGDPKQPVPPKWTPDDGAKAAAAEIGFDLSPEKQIGSMKMSGLTEDMIAKLKDAGQTPQYEFTDRRPDSKTRGLTFYVPEGATKEQILDAYQRKLKEYEPPKPAASPAETKPAAPAAKAPEAGVPRGTIGAGIQAAPEGRVIFHATATGKKSRWIKTAGEWFRADSQWKPKGKALEPMALRDALEEQLQRQSESTASIGKGIQAALQRKAEAGSVWNPVGDIGSRHLFGTNTWTRETTDGTFRIHKLAGENAGKFAVNFIAKDGTKKHIGIFKNITEAKKSTEPTLPTIGAGIQKAIERKAEAGAVTIPKGVTEAVTKAADYAKSVADEELKAPKMTDRRKAVLNWSAKLQRSFNEADIKQRSILKAVPNKVRREGITNWIQADGDANVLRQRASATTDPKLLRGYEAALNLTPEEISVANQVKADYANFAARGQSADVLGQLKENYVTQTWDLGKGPSGGMTGRTLKERFRHSKASTFPTFFDGEQAGYTPKTKDIAKLLPMYSHEMNSVIAAREMVAEMGGGVASDGRPLLAPKGIGVPVEDPITGEKSTLVMPKVGKEATADYKVLPNQPALSGWRWASTDSAGNPVFLKADLALHPEAYDRLKNVLGRSAIRDWYGTRTTALAEIPKAIVKGIDMANSETKRTMLGLLATFHQVQTGTHAIGHRVNPLFNIPKIDLANNKLQMDAAKHGLMLAPDRASMDQFMEGFRTSGLISRVPVIGPAADWYGHYLFHDYIPGLKFKTYDAILNRNLKVFAKDLKSGKVQPADVKILSAEQANAAYGHINYADLGRNPTVQHFAQIGLLAPDFLEARARFAGQAIKGIAGGKVGREQLLAIGTLAIAQSALAYTTAQIVGGEWDWHRPFEFTLGNRRYTLRSIPEDAQNLMTHTRQFIHNRLSPLVGKGIVQGLTGVDYRGRKVTAAETAKEIAAQPVPLTVRGWAGLSPSTLSGMEQFLGSLGLRISRYSPEMDMRDVVKKWKEGSGDPKLEAQVEQAEKETYASVYEDLRRAIQIGNEDSIRKEYEKIKKIRTPKQINEALKPWTGGNLNRETLEISPRKPKPFTGSLKTERQFIREMTPEQRDLYQKSQAERVRLYETFRNAIR